MVGFKNIYRLRNRKYGFTLAEVLLAVVVVGIIAVIVLPNLISDYQKKSMTMLFKKSYNDLVHNLTEISSEKYYKSNLYNSILEKNTANVTEFLKYYDITKDCGTTPSPCFAKDYLPISGSSTQFKCENGRSFLVKGGYAICIVQAQVPSTPAKVTIDVNGPSAPNIGGRDMFTFSIWEDFSADDLAPSDRTESARNTKADSCLSSSVGDGCFSKILNSNWIMDY